MRICLTGDRIGLVHGRQEGHAQPGRLPRYHGIFAPNSRDRAAVTPASRGKAPGRKIHEPGHQNTPARRRTDMNWSQRLKRVFGVEIETCAACVG